MDTTSPNLSGWRDKALYTPGPLSTSQTVKQAMQRDLGSRDTTFIALIQEIRERLLEIGEVAGKGYKTIIVQGSGTFGIEAVLGSITPPDGHWLVIVNGSYGRRIVEINRVLGIQTTVLEFPENKKPSVAEVAASLDKDPTITHVAIIHCETTTGIFNPIEEIGTLVKQAKKIYFVDAMSSFGAVPLKPAEWGVDYIVSSANKCIEGVPGFSFALARSEALLATRGFARSLSLDLLAQLEGLETSGQFRFTPPTHALLAFSQALQELREEGGVQARAARYKRNYEVVAAGMREQGFEEYLRKEDQGYIINSYLYPDHPNFKFETFYKILNEKGFVIYPGKLSAAECFRIGNIGRLFEADMRGLLGAIRETLAEMKISLTGR
ncbi:MAG: 2-aminoethylphosphonate--pyruvate transaminase [SAR324 cluster bacterium]|nr:2-aminoethylphosphonate--pyruvate transaminase [SAR324 cluster bacterium]